MLSNLFAKKRLPICDLFAGMTDIHLHLLPNVDDGVQNVADATVLLQWMQCVGVKRIVFTPHVMSDYPLNRREYLQERFDTFRTRVPPGIECHLAAEYMLDSAFSLHYPDGLLTYDGRKVLVETSYLSAPSGFENMLYEMALNGYQPVLAHPERYLYMNEQMYASLKRKGCFFQLNFASVSGYYGKEVQKRSEWLLKKQYYDFAATDMHCGKQCDVFSTYRVSLNIKNELQRLIKQNDLLGWNEKTE